MACLADRFIRAYPLEEVDEDDDDATDDSEEVLRVLSGGNRSGRTKSCYSHGYAKARNWFHSIRQRYLYWLRRFNYDRSGNRHLLVQESDALPPY